MLKKISDSFTQKDKIMAQEKKKRSKFPVFMIIIILIVLIGLAWKFGWLDGLGRGNKDDRSPDSSETVSNTESENQTADEAGAEEINIEIKSDEIFYNGQKISLEDCKTKLEQLPDKYVLTLIDNEAIQSTYQEVLNILNEKEVAFDQISK